MRTLVALLLFLALCSASASAQIVAVHFKDQKAANKVKDYLILYKGEYVLVGEPYSNLHFDPEKGLTKTAGQPIGILVADPDDPTKVPYKWEGENKVVTSKKQVISISDSAAGEIEMFMRDESLSSVARMYLERKQTVDEALAARDAQAKGGPRWMAAHQKALSQMERLRSWLESTMFPRAAEKLDREIIRQRKNVAAEALATRGAAGKASIKPGLVPEHLVKCSQAISGGKDTFKAMESMHCRIIYRDFFPDERISAALEFAEDAIDGFRIDFVDPYLDEDYEDYIPDKPFAEWFLGPDNREAQERYFVEFYGGNWGDKKEELLKAAGTGMGRSTSPEFIHYWRAADGFDLEGAVAHQLGHDLAGIHYDRKRMGMTQDWLEEAVGYYIALEWFGRNTVACYSLEEGAYAGKKQKEGEKSGQQGLRDWFNQLALEKGQRIDRLVLRKLFEFDDSDLAKSWSIYDYIAKKGGREGQQWLRACCTAARTPATFIAEWRKKSEEIWNVQGQDVFAVIEAKWREYATTEQDTGDTKKR